MGVILPAPDVLMLKGLALRFVGQLFLLKSLGKHSLQAVTAQRFKMERPPGCQLKPLSGKITVS